MNMKDTPENIGRKIIFKNVFISIICIFLAPLLLVFILNLGNENKLNYLTFYQNVVKSASISTLSIVLQLCILLASIYIIGGITGRKILKEKTHTFKKTFISLNIICLCYFITAMINELIMSVHDFGFTSDIIGSVVLAWINYGFILFILTSLIYSSILGIFISREFKQAIKKEFVR
jgi:hypothetical protein